MGIGQPAITAPRLVGLSGHAAETLPVSMLAQIRATIMRAGLITCLFIFKVLPRPSERCMMGYLTIYTTLADTSLDCQSLHACLFGNSSLVRQHLGARPAIPGLHPGRGRFRRSRHVIGVTPTSPDTIRQGSVVIVFQPHRRDPVGPVTFVAALLARGRQIRWSCCISRSSSRPGASNPSSRSACRPPRWTVTSRASRHTSWTA